MRLISDFISLVLLFNIREVFVNGLPSPGCCFTKEVGNDRYVLVNPDTDTSEFGCESNCVYEKDSEPDSRYCFKTGPLPFQCVSKQAPKVSTYSISEDNEELVQTNSYQNETGVLELRVPPHKDYTESLFILHQDSGTTMLKTNNTCQLADLPEDLNVSEMAGNFEANDKRRVGEPDKLTSFILKSRKARYGSRKRKTLIPDVQYRCKDTSVVKTKDVPVNETEFEKYKNGEVIFIKNGKSSRLCETVTACSDQGPRACGYGWTNPDPNAASKGFSFHQVSSGSVCVSCYIDTPIPGDAPCNTDLCLCKDITTKEKLQTCSVQSVINTTIEIEQEGVARNKRNPSLLVQNIVFNKKASALSLAIDSPAHKDIGGLEVVMHAREDGYWHASNLKNNRMLKLGGACHIGTLPQQVFPVDIALGMQEIKAGNEVTTADDEEERHHILLDDGLLEAGEEGNLHPDIKSRCLGSPMKKIVEADITKSQGEDLKKGKIIFKKSSGSRNGNCQLETAATTDSGRGCWRWPNPDGSKLMLHSIVHSVVHVTCCRTLIPSTCCADNHWQYCACEDITLENFNQCRDPKALFVATGVSESSPTSSVEVLAEGINGTYTSKKMSIGGCSEIPNFPADTSSATGGLFNGAPHICRPAKSENQGQCYRFEKDGSWTNVFNLVHSQNSWASSAVFRNWNGYDSAWWIVGDAGTELWAGTNPQEVSTDGMKPPVEINKPCITKISDYEAFVTATPKFEPAETNFAWIFNIQSNSWTRLPNTLEKRSGPACGYLNLQTKPISGRFVVLAGGLSSSTSEILDLNTNSWTSGPTIGMDLYASGMVSVNAETELLLVGGYNGEGASPNILKMDSSMDSWNITGQLAPPKFNAVALAVPFDSLPPLCSA